MENQIIDHLFRHQYGKMVSILTNIFGLPHLETIEDAVQDIFIKAMIKWRNQIPENPEAWLTAAAKNRVIDLLRKIKSENNRVERLEQHSESQAIEELFLEDKIEDSQLRMIFTACHPTLDSKDQIAFALKSIAGFSIKEIASALLLKEDTIKKRLQRARKTIKNENISFTIPDGSKLQSRLDSVFEVIYLIFNEGFHSNNQKYLIRSDLCGEAMRLNQMILKKESLRNGAGYALFALHCFQSSRLESKQDAKGQIIDLKNQDRSRWYKPLIELGREAMYKSLSYSDYCAYHVEGAIAMEHLDTSTFDKTNWNKILALLKILIKKTPSPLTKLNTAFVLIQLKNFEEAKHILDSINPNILEQRKYLFYGTKAEYFQNTGDLPRAIECLMEAISSVTNESEKNYLQKKKNDLLKLKIY